MGDDGKIRFWVRIDQSPHKKCHKWPKYRPFDSNAISVNTLTRNAKMRSFSVVRHFICNNCTIKQQLNCTSTSIQGDRGDKGERVVTTLKGDVPTGIIEGPPGPPGPPGKFFSTSFPSTQQNKTHTKNTHILQELKVKEVNAVKSDHKVRLSSSSKFIFFSFLFESHLNRMCVAIT